jgi:hypothetical protein
MSGVVGNWRLELIERHRDLFQPPADFPRAAAGCPECDGGWHDLLERLCVRIRGAVQAEAGAFRFSQIKSKYATLRVYWDGVLSREAAARVEEAIALAEARSAVTCEVCGEEGRLRGGAWVTTRCDAHAEGRPAVEPVPASRTCTLCGTSLTAGATPAAGATTAIPIPSLTSIPLRSGSRNSTRIQTRSSLSRSERGRT